MTTVLLIIHLFVTLSLIGLVLIQRSEGGGLGIGSSQGMGAFMGGRGTANLLSRTTAILGALFFTLSLTLALLNRGTNGAGHSLLDGPAAATSPVLPAPAPLVVPGSSAPATMPPAPAIPTSTPPAPATPASPTTGAATPATPDAPKGPTVPTN